MKGAILALGLAAAVVTPAAAQWCPQGQIPVSVEGGQTGCATPQVCVANTWGNCPAGSYCGTVKTGVLGCKLGSPPSGQCSNGQIPVSVEGGETGCAYPQVCVAETWGNCPAGSYCTRVKTGVYGCRKNGWQPNAFYSNSYSNAITCPNGQVSVSVEGGSDGCAYPQICVANTWGNCPAGSYCGTVKTGVLGCKLGSPPTAQCSNGQIPVSVEGGETGCAYPQVCSGTIQGNCPTGSYCTTVKTGVYGCRKNGWQPNGLSETYFNSYMNSEPQCPAGQAPVSVEGGQTGCARTPVCVGNSYGYCPSGSYCGRVQSGVLGCKVGNDDDDDYCPPGEDPVSVEYGQTGCARTPVCGGETWGNCPAGAVCGRVSTGVLGCTLKKLR